MTNRAPIEYGIIVNASEEAIDLSSQIHVLLNGICKFLVIKLIRFNSSI